MPVLKQILEKIRKKAAPFLKGESGQSLVVAALAFTVLLGGAALAIDLGASYTAQQKMQNAADEAALAAVRVISESVSGPTYATVEKTALDYAELNGAKRENTTVTWPYKGDKYRVEVICTREMAFSFASAIGHEKGEVGARAVAECQTLRGPFDYAIFSGNQRYEMQFNAGIMEIGGSVHSNDDLAMNSSGITVHGSAEAVNDLAVRSSSIVIEGECIAGKTERNGQTVTGPHGPVMDMPDFTDIVKAAADKAGTHYKSSKQFYGDGINLENPIFVDGDVSFSAPTVISGSGIIIATGNITFNTASVLAPGCSVCFYSKNGNIQINAGKITVDGLLYAPNGTIQAGVSSLTVNGRVVADKVMLNASSVQINTDEHDRDCLPRLEIALVE